MKSLAFLLGAEYSAQQGSYLIGEQTEAVELVDARSLTPDHLAALSSDRLRLSRVGGQVLLRGSPDQIEKAKALLLAVQVPERIRLELLVTDTSADHIQEWGAWLRSFQATLKAANTTELSRAAAGLSPALTNATSSTLTFSLDDVLKLEKTGGYVQVTASQTLDVAAGGTVTFASGDVLADELYNRFNQSETTVKSDIVRRTVGFDSTLTATKYDQQHWHIAGTMTDGLLAQGGERKTQLTFGQPVPVGTGWTLLCEYSRKQENDEEKRLRPLSESRLFGWMRNRTLGKTQRVVQVWVRVSI